MKKLLIGIAGLIAVIILAVIILVFSGVRVWNKLNRNFQMVEGAKSHYSAALNTCTEKIKGVWEIANQYMNHESETFNAVTEARSGYETASEAYSKAASENKGTEELTKAGAEVVKAAMAFRIQVEAYPNSRRRNIAGEHAQHGSRRQ